MRDADVLQQFDIFSGLTKENFEIIRPMLQPGQYWAGTDIYKPGEISEHLYLVLSGEVSIRYNIDHDAITLAQLQLGFFFGEAGILSDKQRHQTYARADTDVKTLALSSANYAKVKQSNPEIALILLNNIARILTSRLDADTMRIGIISALNRLTNNPENVRDPEALAQSVLNIALAVIPAQRAFIGIYRPHQPEELQIIASKGLNAKELPKRQHDESDPYLPIIKRDTAICLNNSEYLNRTNVRYAKKNLLAQSITTDLKTVGVIVLADKNGGEFTSRNQLLLEIIAGHIAFAFEASEQRQEHVAREELQRKYVGM